MKLETKKCILLDIRIKNRDLMIKICCDNSICFWFINIPSYKFSSILITDPVVFLYP